MNSTKERRKGGRVGKRKINEKGMKKHCARPETQHARRKRKGKKGTEKERKENAEAQVRKWHQKKTLSESVLPHIFKVSTLLLLPSPQRALREYS